MSRAGHTQVALLGGRDLGPALFHAPQVCLSAGCVLQHSPRCQGHCLWVLDSVSELVNVPSPQSSTGSINKRRPITAIPLDHSVDDCRSPLTEINRVGHACTGWPPAKTINHPAARRAS